MKDTITTQPSPLQGLCCSDGMYPRCRLSAECQELNTVGLTVLRTTGHRMKEQTGRHLLRRLLEDNPEQIQDRLQCSLCGVKWEANTCIRNVWKSLCLMAKLQIPVLTPVTFKHLHHTHSKLLYQTEKSDNSGGLQNVWMGQYSENRYERFLLNAQCYTQKGIVATQKTQRQSVLMTQKRW